MSDSESTSLIDPYPVDCTNCTQRRHQEQQSETLCARDRSGELKTALQSKRRRSRSIRAKLQKARSREVQDCVPRSDRKSKSARRPRLRAASRCGCRHRYRRPRAPRSGTSASHRAAPASNSLQEEAKQQSLEDYNATKGKSIKRYSCDGRKAKQIDENAKAR